MRITITICFASLSSNVPQFPQISNMNNFPNTFLLIFEISLGIHRVTHSFSVDVRLLARFPNSLFVLLLFLSFVGWYSSRKVAECASERSEFLVSLEDLSEFSVQWLINANFLLEVYWKLARELLQCLWHLLWMSRCTCLKVSVVLKH